MCDCKPQLPYTRESRTTHLVEHLIAYPFSDPATCRNLELAAREDCCETARKPCSYHEGFADALDIMAFLLRDRRP